jgi:hypothetical protein
MPVTTNMNMTLPTVGVTVDPTWASNLNDALTNKLDLHDHTTGLGVRVPSAGLNINADLSFQSNDATNLRSVALNNNVSTLPSGDVRALYASGGNLYYNNNSGTAIQLTTGSSLNTGALALNVWALTELAGNLTILAGDSFIVINTDTTSARTITLPAASSVTAGRYYIIKDKTGDAATNNITITPAGSDTIDETASSTTISQAYSSLTLISDGVSNWLTNAAVGGFVKLGGDLLGTGSTVLSPRVGTLTGIAGLVTMANNTAINTRNLANDTNVNVAKMNASNVIALADSAFASTWSGTALTLTAGSTSITATSNTSTSITATTSATLQAGSGNAVLGSTSADVNITAGDDVNVTATDDFVVTCADTAVTASTGAIALTATAGSIAVSAGNDVTVTATDDVAVTAGDDFTLTATAGDIAMTAGATVSISATTSLTLAGQLFLPTKAVTSATYTVDTTTKDVVIFCDSTSTAINITLPTCTIGRTLIIQDVGGNAGTNNITLTRASGGDQIQGLTANYVMDANYQGVTLVAYSGGSWFIVGTS